MSSIEWPEFLYRAWRINLDVPDVIWYYDRAQRTKTPDRWRGAAIENIFYSLCSSLGSGNCCRILNYKNPLHKGFTAAEIRTAYYPLRLLGSHWEEVYNKEADNGVGAMVPLIDDKLSQQVAALRQSTLAPKQVLAFRLNTCISKAGIVSPTLGGGSKLAFRIVHAGSLVLGRMTEKLKKQDDKRSDRMLRGAVNYLRDLLTGNHIQKDNVELLDEIKQLLLLEIELRTPRDGGVK
jgi:hypothetical protein